MIIAFALLVMGAPDVRPWRCVMHPPAKTIKCLVQDGEGRIRRASNTICRCTIEPSR